MVVSEGVLQDLVVNLKSISHKRRYSHSDVPTAPFFPAVVPVSSKRQPVKKHHCGTRRVVGANVEVAIDPVGHPECRLTQYPYHRRLPALCGRTPAGLQGWYR